MEEGEEMGEPLRRRKVRRVIKRPRDGDASRSRGTKRRRERREDGSDNPVTKRRRNGESALAVPDASGAADFDGWQELPYHHQQEHERGQGQGQEHQPQAGIEIRFRTPFTMIVSGATQSGKTTYVHNLLRSMPHMFTRVPDYVIYFYSQWQPTFTKMKGDWFDPDCHKPPPAPPESYETAALPDQWGAGVEPSRLRPIINRWENVLPTIELLKKLTDQFKEGNGSLVIIDDFVAHLDEEISELFTVLSHANNISVILLTQNLFSKNKFFRNVSLNSMYITFFKNPRDGSQIQTFAHQISPHSIRWVVDAFHECTKAPYSYLTFDSHQATPNIARLRSDYLPGEGPPRVWYQADDTAGYRGKKRKRL